MRALIAFWVLAFLVSWGSGALVAVSDQSDLVNGVHATGGALPLPFAAALLLLLVSGSGPAVAAIVVVAAETGWGGVRSLLGQVLHWRAPVVWYVVALVLPFLLTLIATGVWAVVSGARPSRWLPLPTLFQLFALPLFPWGEEIGWRGFAQPRLQASLPWLPASVIVGVMWGAWHQWPLLTPAGNGLDMGALAVFFVYIVSEAVLIGWIYNRAGRKLPLGWAGHAGLNAVGSSPTPFGLVAAAFAATAMVVAIAGGPKPPSAHPSDAS